MSKKKQRVNYSSDFRLNAFKKSLEPNTQVQGVADELGIPPAYLTRVARELEKVYAVWCCPYPWSPTITIF